MNYFSFEILHSSKKSRARVGQIKTPHGTIDTPNFVAVGTNGTLKALDSVQVNNLGLQLMFCNTYHLMLQPGTDLIKKAGGLHSFINRPGPIITDSGGFQVFSLAYGTVKDELKSKGTKKRDSSVLNISEEGVLFRSYRDGKSLLLTPESSIAAQKNLGADIIIPFDELPPYHMKQADLIRSLERTHRWEKRSLDAHLQNPQNQAIFAVIHGGIDTELRKKSCQYLSSLPFNGFGIGGSLGKNHQELYNVVSFTTNHLSSAFPRHLLGIGDLTALKPCIELGIDTFDSSHPTRCARHGFLFTQTGGRRILQSGNSEYFGPIEADCTCITCQNYTVSYLHHLFKAHELTAYTLATIHNLHFMVKLMEKYRQSIIEGIL